MSTTTYGRGPAAFARRSVDPECKQLAILPMAIHPTNRTNGSYAMERPTSLNVLQLRAGQKIDSPADECFV